MGRRVGLVAVILIGMFMLPLVGIVSSSAMVYINYALVNSTLTVETLHYKIVLNATLGGIVELNVTDDFGRSHSLLYNSSEPSLGLYVDGVLLKNGVVKVVGEQKDRSLVVDIIYNTTYGNITERLYFYSWTPYIDVLIISEKYVENLTINLIVKINQNENLSIKKVYTYIKNENLTSQLIVSDGVHNITGDELPIALSIIGIKSESNQTGLSNMTFFEGYSIAATPQRPSKFIVKQYNENGTIYYKEYITFENVTNVNLGMLATNYPPSILLIPPFAIALGTVANIDQDIDIIARLNKYVQDLKDRIEALNNTVKTLRERNNELQKQLDYYKGCEDHYKQEITARDYQIESLKNRLQRTGFIEGAVFIIGIILGVIGGRYIVSEK